MGSNRQPGPTVRRRQLGRELRRLREDAGKTIAEAAQWVGIKPPTISKIENGRQAIRPTNVRLLLQLYGIGAPQADTLIRLAGEANQRGWWASYGDTVPDWFRNFVGLESDANEINGYDSELIPGQLQTAEYAEAVILAAYPNTTRDELARISTQLVQGKGPPGTGVGSGMDDHGEGVAQWSSGSVALDGSFGATYDHRLGRISRGQRG